MTTLRSSRLVITIAALAFTTIFLVEGSVRSAGKGDRSAPTTPTNLKVTAITPTTVSLSWTGSTDNSGKLSYGLKITNLNNSAYNSLASIAQTQTTYTAKYLLTNSSYTFAVYAVDANGNRSADSNVVSANTPANTTPPTAPVLQSSVLSPSQVRLQWTLPSDNAGYCCTYSVNMNGSPYTGQLNWVAAPSGSYALTIRHLPPGSTNIFSVTAKDYTGVNVATSNTVIATTEPSSDVIPPTAPTNLHLVRDDSCGELYLGWNQATDNTDDQYEIEYEIYVNGVLSPLPVSAGVDVDFVYATFHGDNTFTVKAVDRSGNSSQASIALKLFEWPC